jgi:hypothetical protein
MTLHTGESYCEMILYPFIGHLNDEEVARGHCKHSSRFHDPTPRYVQEQHNFKEHLATTVA